MFSKSRRFIQPAPQTPAVGQYDVSQKQSQGSAVLFPKDKRFKESVTTENSDKSMLDISNCSTSSAKSSSSGKLDHSVFATPGKPCRNNKNVLSTSVRKKCKSAQAATSEEDKDSLTTTLSQLQEELEKLKSENEMLKMLPDVVIDESNDALNSRITALMEDVERLRNENEVLTNKCSELESAAQEHQSLESNVAMLTDELEKLKSDIEKEILKNKELVIEQSKYECSIETIKTDLDLANRKVTVLQEQIHSLDTCMY